MAATATATALKSKFSTTNYKEAGSSDIQNKNFNYHRTIPEAHYGYPPTPQSYHSPSSPYQNHENLPNVQTFLWDKNEGNLLGSRQQSNYQHSFSNFAEQQQFFGEHFNGTYIQKMKRNKQPIIGSFRYDHYDAESLEQSKSHEAAPPDNSVYLQQPTPSPSPKLRESTTPLIEHNNLANSNIPQVQPNNNEYLMFEQSLQPIDDAILSEILGPDSDKVVHSVCSKGKEEKQQSVSAMMTCPLPQQPQIVHGERNIFNSEDQTLYSNLQNISEGNMFSIDRQLLQLHQTGNQKFKASGVSSFNAHMVTTHQQLRTFEHLPTPLSSVVSGTQVPQVPTINAVIPLKTNIKGAKRSDKASKPKTYPCTACKRSFISSGHLRRHYNTMLHKNCVRDSGHGSVTTSGELQFGVQYKLATLKNHEVMQQSFDKVNQVPQYSPTSCSKVFVELNYKKFNHTNFTYLTQVSLQPLTKNVAHHLVTATNAREDSKENYVENTLVRNSSNSSTIVPHQDERNIKCYECNRVFSRPCYLTQHSRTYHNGDKPYKCTRCGKRFQVEYTYNEHIRKHGGDKPHKCDKCPKMYNHKGDLRRHTSCHTGQKPFSCTICGKTFIRKDHMNKHMYTHYKKEAKLSAVRS